MATKPKKISDDAVLYLKTSRAWKLSLAQEAEARANMFLSLNKDVEAEAAMFEKVQHEHAINLMDEVIIALGI